MIRVYRLHGGTARPDGLSWTTIDPRMLDDPRRRLGLPEANTAEFLTIGEMTDDTGVLRRLALPLDGNPGGAPELLIPSPATQVVVIEIRKMGIEGDADANGR